MLGRRRRAERGQAMAEYAIVLALVSGAAWAQRLAENVLSAEPTTLIAAGAVGLTVVFVFVAGRR